MSNMPQRYIKDANGFTQKLVFSRFDGFAILYIICYSECMKMW